MTRHTLLALASGVLLGIVLSLFVVDAASRAAQDVLRSGAAPMTEDAAPAQPGAPLATLSGLFGEPSGQAASRQSAAHGAPSPAATVDGPQRPTPSGASVPALLRGIASWYDGSRSWHGVPHVALPGARWSAATPWGWARVCVVATGLCEVLPVVDRCDCVVGGSRRIVDLSAEAVAELDLDPARGLYRVTVESWRTP